MGSRDWLLEAMEGLERALANRSRVGQLAAALSRRAPVDQGRVVEATRDLPAGRHRNTVLDVELANAIDAAIIGSAQEEARRTGRKESFVLPDGAIGSVDARGALYDERPPQG